MITLQVNDAAFNRAFADLEKQLRFAAAQALTKTAQDAQEAVKQQLPKRFTIRTNWLARGVRIRPASRTTLQATVLVLDRFMAQQETGGEKASPFPWLSSGASVISSAPEGPCTAALRSSPR